MNEENESSVRSFTPPPAYADISQRLDQSSQQRERARLQISDIVNIYQINNIYRLSKLSGFKFVFILDDSSTMNSLVLESPLKNRENVVRRWDELKHFCEISLNVANSVSDVGADFYFVNRPSARNIHSCEQLSVLFSDAPNGESVSISNTVQKAFAQNNVSTMSGQSLLMVLAIDIETETTLQEKLNPKWLKFWLLSRPLDVYTVIVSFTNYNDSVTNLNHWHIPRFGVLNDYQTERIEIQKHFGGRFDLTFGDYVAKALLSSIDPSVNNVLDIKCCNIV